MVTELVLLIIGGYLLGSLPADYLAARWARGIDLRQYGSGSVGITNLGRATSRRIAMAVGIFDLVKPMIVVWLAKLTGLDIAGQLIAGLMVVIGHNWSIFLRFQGGRGIIATIGLIFILPLLHGMVPWELIIGLTITAIFAFTVRNLPLGVLFAMGSLPLVSWLVGKPLVFTLGFLALFIIMIIRRLALPRSAMAASLSTREILVNRFLFDRDIRDRETWLNRTSE